MSGKQLVKLSISLTTEEYAALEKVAEWLGLRSREAVVVWCVHASLNAVLKKGIKEKPSLWLKLKSFFTSHPEITA